nr:methyltransferase [Pseudoclavibacter helvolus]
MWVASDLGGVQLGRDQPLRRDHVVGIGPATTLLAQLTPREPVARALDLGVGMGVQTMHLLAHTRHVVATDISERALAFAKFNLLLNAAALGIAPGGLDERVSLRLGNMLEPVAGEQFDLFVSNPPFVITPRREGEEGSDQYTYRDGGKPGDSIVEGLVRELGTVLAPGGVACMLGNWEVRQGDANWHSRLEAWPANDVDLWVVQREDATPVEYADMWLKDAAENAELSSWQHAFRRYLQDFASRDVERIGMGMFFLRRTHEGAVGGPLRRFEHLTHALGHPLAEHIRDGFEAITWLRGVDDAELFDEPLVVAGDVTEERHSRPGDEDPSIIMLRQGAGFRRTMSMSTELTGFVSVCDGELVGSQIVTAIASLVDVEEEALRASLVPDVRELVALGFLEPRWR